MTNKFEEFDGEIAKANDLYRSKNYTESLRIYEKISLRPGWGRLVYANVALCRKFLNLSTKLSIVVPVFNTEKYLEQCLKSIINQSEASLEIIVINDGSSDKSLDLIKKMMKKDKRIVLINNDKPSGNPGTPRNQGIAIASGKYLGFVDSDDWIEPDYYKNLLEAIEKDNLDIAFSSGYKNYINGEGKAISYDSSFYNSEDKELRGYHQSFMIWDKIYKTSQIKKNAILLGETKAAVDVPFILKAYFLLKKAGFSQTKGYNYRRESESSVTVNFRKSSNCDFEIQAYKDFEAWCIKFNVDNEYRNIAKFRKINSFIYTLQVIAQNEFEGFFKKINIALKDVDSNLVKKFSDRLGKPEVFEKLKTIMAGNPENYKKLYLNDIAKKNNRNYALKELPIRSNEFLNIEGENSGILFFPDYSKSNAYQKLFYASLAQNYDVRVLGASPSKLSKGYLKTNREKFSYLHLHWLHKLMDVTREDGADELLEKLKYAKSLGYTILYTAHNIISHDSEFSDREIRFRRSIAAYFDHVFAHGEFAKQKLIKEIGISKDVVTIIPHGSYQGYYQNNITQSLARKRLNIDDSKFVFLFFGNIRGYKGIEALIDSYKKVKSKVDDVVLLIAGRVFEQEILDKINNFSKKDSSVIFHPEFIEDGAVQNFLNASDVVILPYKNILTSGTALLSLSFEKPVIAPRNGLLPELISSEQQGFLFNNYEEMQEIMISCARQKNTNQKKWIENFDFSEVNSRLRWPLITGANEVAKIFAAAAKTECYIEKKSNYKYALVRILGNDLPMRHSQEQTYENLRFALENETEFEDCLKLWILNRIVDEEKKNRLINLLSSYGKEFIDIPYNPKELAKVSYCFDELPKSNWKLMPDFKNKPERVQLIAETAILRKKNNYIMNNNGARNFALESGIKEADWVFPWDGNCFLTDSAWENITSQLNKRSDLQYHIVPMERLLANLDVLQDGYIPNPVEEPQIIFRKDAKLRFNEWLMYGLQPKVELFKRLGVPGIWDSWKKFYPWLDEVSIQHRSESFNYSWAGWTARLFSGNEGQETDAEQRANMRRKGIISFIASLDVKCTYQKFRREDLVFYNEETILSLQRNYRNKKSNEYDSILINLLRSATNYIGNPIYSVIDKTTVAPSNNKKDYWHPAPYSWPNPNTSDGFPYIYKDGERVPGTKMYEPESIRYDRTSIQRVFDETTTLALAGFIFSNNNYTEKAVNLVRNWFIGDETSMNPNLTYAQVIMGKNANEGTASGIIETKDMYFFLDAVRLISKSHFWKEDDEKKMQSWCEKFLDWLNTSKQGKEEVISLNNHGIAFDLQTYALAAYIGDVNQMYEIQLRAQSRLKEHIDKNGKQPHEMRRTTTAHYTAFNLHLWCNFATLLKRTAGKNLFNEEYVYETKKLSPLKKAAEWILDHADGEWPYKQIDEFDKDRYQHIYHVTGQYSSSLRKKYNSLFKEQSNSKPVFFPHDGIAPYWIFSLH